MPAAWPDIVGTVVPLPGCGTMVACRLVTWPEVPEEFPAGRPAVAPVGLSPLLAMPLFMPEPDDGMVAGAPIVELDPIVPAVPPGAVAALPWCYCICHRRIARHAAHGIIAGGGVGRAIGTVVHGLGESQGGNTQRQGGGQHDYLVHHHLLIFLIGITCAMCGEAAGLEAVFISTHARRRFHAIALPLGGDFAGVIRLRAGIETRPAAFAPGGAALFDIDRIVLL